MLLMILAILALPVFAAVLPLNLTEQVQEADYILKGRIESRETVYSGKARFVGTRYKLVVEKDFLGNFPQRELIFQMAGGIDGEKTFRASDVPMLDIGEQSIFMLYRPEKKHFSLIVGSFQGRYTMSQDPDSGNQYVLDGSRKPIIENGQTITFADFEKRLTTNIPVFLSQPRTFFPPDPMGNPNNLQASDFLRWDASDKRGRTSPAVDPVDAAMFDAGPHLNQRIYTDLLGNQIGNPEDQDDRYTWGHIWSDPPTVFNQLPNNYATLGRRDQAMMAFWNKYADLFRVRSTPTGTFGYPDFENDICGLVDNAGMEDVFEYTWGPETLAITFSWWINYLWEADIAFNSAFAWTASSFTSYHTNRQPIDHVFLHELGHAWGADHSWYSLSVMNYYQKEFRVYTTLYASDASAIRHVYESDIQIRNLGLYNHYSAGNYQQFEPASSDTLVTPGLPLTIRNITLENPGTYSMTANVDVFLTPLVLSWSRAIYITTVNLGTLGPETTHLIPSFSINIPMITPPGYYHVALRIATGGDQIGYDNAAWIMNRVRVTDPPVPGLWVGGTSGNWHVHSNWDTNSVPDANTDVLIPAGCLHNPRIIQDQGFCADVTIDPGAALSIEYNTTFYGDVLNHGALLLGNPVSAPDVIIHGNFRNGEGGMLSFGDSSAILRVYGAWSEHYGSATNMQPNGTLQFIGASPSTIVLQSPENHFNDFQIQKDPGGEVYFNNACGAPANIHGHFLIGPNNSVYYQSDQDMNIYEDLACPASSYFEALSGTIHMLGMGGGIEMSANSNINSLNIDAAGMVSLFTDLRLNGDLIISSGSFNAGYHTIYIKGSWFNNVGLDAFMEQTSNVIFNGGEDQNLYTETFYSMTLNKPSGRIMMRPGSTINTQSYTAIRGEILIQGATFNVTDITNTNGIWGNYRVESGEINLHQDSSGSIDLNGNWTILSGTVRIYGGSSSCWFAASGPASLIMSSGVLDFVDQGVYINDTGYDFAENITGGTIRTGRSFMVGRSDFSPTNSMVELYGPNDAYVGTAAGSGLWHLLINKSSRANTIIGSNLLIIRGNFGIMAGSFIAPETMYVDGDWINLLGPDAFIEGTGTVVFQGGGHQYCSTENFNTLRIAKSGGAFRVQFANVVCNSYVWASGAVDLIIGNFTALDLAQDGIYGNFYVNFLSTLTLHQDAETGVDLNGILNIHGGECHVYGGNVTSWWGYALPAIINMSAGLIYFHDQGIEISNNSVLNITGGTIRTDGSFALNKEYFQGSGWTLELTGSSDVGLWLDSNSWLCNLTINKIATRSESIPMRDRNGNVQNTRGNSVYANTNLQVSGNVIIGAGSFRAPDLMVVHGNWTDTAISGGFLHENGTVTFIGFETSNFVGSTGFYNCNINKACENTAVLIHSNSYFDANNLSIMDGLVLTSSQSSISTFNIVISDGAGLNLSGEEITYTLRGNFTNYNTLNNQTRGFYAGTSQINIESAFDQYFTNQVPINLYDVMIRKSNGVSFQPNTALTMHDLWIEMGGFYSASSVSHTVTGDLDITHGQWFDHTSTLYLTGSEDQTISTNSNYLNPDNAWFNNIIINKPGGIVNLSTSPIHLRNQGNLSIMSGILDLNNREIYSTGVITVGNGAVLRMDAGSEIHIGYGLEVIDGGSIQIAGSASEPALVTRNGVNYPSFAIGHGGSIAADHCIFEYINGSGVYLLPGALVDSNHAFNYCTFRNGAENGSLLTLNDSNCYTITGASFPANTWNSVYNVSKSVEEGEVFFSQVSGDFAGPGFEYDTHNRIHWNDFRADLVVSSAAWSVPSMEIGNPVSFTATIRNIGNVPSVAFYLDLIYNLGQPPEFGTNPDNSQLVEAIAAGDSVVVNFPDIYWGVAENWHSWLIADGSNAVVESNENNNVSGPYLISWVEPQLPNLSISVSSWTETNPIVGDFIDLTVFVTNSSTVDVTDPVDIDLYFNPGGVPDGSAGGDLVYAFSDIPAGETVQYTFTGITSYTAEIWQSYVLLDRSNAILEADETDNIAGPSSVTWVNPPLPNLTVLIGAWSNSDPYLGEEIQITVSVSNPSEVSVETPFAIDLFFNPGSLPDGSANGDLWHIFSAVAAGQTVEYTFTGITSSSVETWQSYVLLDRTNGIAESDELDNNAAALPISWHELPPVTSLTISHLPGTGQIKLEWIYNGPFDRFNIYASPTPDGAFDALSGTSTNHFFILDPDAASQFFRVKAEKDILRLR